MNYLRYQISLWFSWPTSTLPSHEYQPESENSELGSILDSYLEIIYATFILDISKKIVAVAKSNEWQKRQGAKSSQFDRDLFSNDKWMLPSLHFEVSMDHDVHKYKWYELYNWILSLSDLIMY